MHFWSSNELALTVVGVLCSDPNKNLGIYLKKKITKKKGNVKKEEIGRRKKKTTSFSGLFPQGKSPGNEVEKKIIVCVGCLAMKSMNASNTGTCPRSHVADFHTQRDASSKTSQISVQKPLLLFF